MSEPQHFEVRTDDNRLFCMARLIEGDILLILKSAGREIHIPYTIFRDLSLWRGNGKSVKQDNDRYGENNRVYVFLQGTIPIHIHIVCQ